jgi:hypothetical protein
MKPLTEGNMKSGVKSLDADAPRPNAPPPAGRPFRSRPATGNSITERKLHALMKSSSRMDLTGYILTDPNTDQIAFIHAGRVRWYDHEEAMVILGHTEKKDGKD